MSTLLTALKNLPTSILDNIVRSGDDVLKRVARARSGVADSAANSANAAKAVRANADDFAASTAEGASKFKNITDAKQGTPPANTIPPADAGGALSSGRTAAKDSTLAKYGITPTKVFAGVSATVIASLALARLDATDGVKVAITDIKILSADKVQIAYTPASKNFNPCVNDTFTFYPPPNPDATPTTPDLSIGGDKTVIQIIDDNTIIIRAALTRAGNSVYPSPSAISSSPASAPAPAISWGKMTCHSDYENQLAQGIGEVVAFAAGTAAAAIVQTVGALTPAATEVLGAAAGGAANIISAGLAPLAPIVSDLFAPILDFFDNFKWIIIAICVILCGGIAAFLVLT